jgi:hypothetical protein
LPSGKRRKTVLTLLLDENIDGYADYLTRFLYAPERNDLSSLLGVSIVTFDQVGLAKGTADDLVWEFCQSQHFYLITDNRNQDTPDSLEATIRARNLPTSLPVFTISDINRVRVEHDYREALAAKLLEYLFDADNLRGTGRLYLP